MAAANANLNRSSASPLRGFPLGVRLGHDYKIRGTCAQQEQAECGNPGGVQKMWHAKRVRKNRKLATGKFTYG
jgi:hypothetical protein